MICEVVIAVHENAEFIRRLKSSLSDAVTVLEKKRIKMLFREIRINPVSCILIYMEQNIPDELFFERFKKKFSNVPCIAIFARQNMELARKCGFLGIESILLFDEIDRIGDEILKVCAFKNNRIKMNEINVIKESVNYSMMLRDAFSVIEQNYVKIQNINEISDLMGIAGATLCREFVKYGFPGPKKVLIYMKIHHAIRLMHNQGLNIREISFLSGFTDEKRMAECFHRMFQMSPGKYRLSIK